MDHRALTVFLCLWSSAVPDDVRLEGGASHCAGILEMIEEGNWRPVQVFFMNWNLMSAVTVCRQLDCGSVLSVKQPRLSRELQITCSDSVRLQDGAGECSGRLELKSERGWSSVSEDGFDLRAAQVVCREIGCGAPSDLQGELYGDADTPGSGKKYRCDGAESTLLDCDSSVSNASGRAVKLTCSELASFRLVGGAGPCGGTLEIKKKGEWRAVHPDNCDPGWANRVCGLLDCGSLVSITEKPRQEWDFAWLHRSQCAESSLEECFTEAEHSEKFLELTCSDSVRLVNGTDRCSGRLERRSGQRWSPVCEGSFDLVGAQLVCNWFNCGEPSVLKGGMFGEEEGGDSCPPGKAVGLTCSDPKVRLVGGPSKCSGNLELKYRLHWRPVDVGDRSSNLKITDQFCSRLDCGSALSTKLVKGSSNRPVWWIDSDCVQFEPALKDCVQPWESLSMFSLKITCSDSVRLVRGTDHCSGRLEVRSDQIWSPVCDEDLDLQGAQVACREIGCGSPSNFKGEMFGEAVASFRSKKFQCEGHESALLDCPSSGVTGSTCPPGRAVGLTCSDPDEVRLLGGSSKCSGKLELKHLGDWRPVYRLGRSLDPSFPAEICRRLDCGSSLSTRQFKESSNRAVWWINPDCLQFTSTLKECVKTWDEPSVNGLEITCSDSVRLVRGTGLCSGRLEVRSDQIWSPVCDKDLDLQGAQVACREIGCGSPSDFKGGMYGEAEASFRSQKFQCEGHESALLDCPSSGLTGNTCPPGRAVGLTCSDPNYVRLVGGPSKCSGKLELKFDAEWRPVDCQERPWTLKDLPEMCRRLDCGSAVSTRRIVESSSRPVWSVIIKCAQFRSSFKECVQRWATSSEFSLEITCSDSVRLVRGTGRCSGRLEVRSDQIWSPVCEEDLDLQVAQVACREIGCGSPLDFKGGVFGEAEAPFRTKKFQCEGHESALLDCGGSGSHGNTCPPGRAVGLTCSDPDEEVRLVGGPSMCSGKLELKYHGQWRLVKQEKLSWDLKDSDVICQRLHCGSALSTREIKEPSETSVWWIDPDCVQFKSTLEDCVTSEVVFIDISMEITCSDSVRLVNETDHCSGRLEVRSDQIWSPVCDKDLDLQGAQVVCREIGCGAPLVIQGGMFVGAEAPFWSKRFQCEGNESALLDCGGSGPGHTCSPGRAVGLTCKNPDYIRLVGEPSRCAGSLEVKYMEEWRPVWDYKGDQESAAVVCKTLNCGSAVSTRLVKQEKKRWMWIIKSFCVQTASSLLQCLDGVSFDRRESLEVVCSNMLEKPTIAFSSSTDGVSEATPQGYQALIGYSFNITCSIKPQYEGGDFQLLFSDSVTTQSYTLTAVNHSAHFLFPPADQSHGGRYSCIYHLHVFSQNFSSESRTLSLAVGAPLIELIIRCVVLIGGLLIYDTALYCYYKVQTRQIPGEVQ